MFYELDENGEETDVVARRPETKSLVDVERVISLNKPQAVVEKFAAMYLLGLQWDWFEKHQQWQRDEPQLDSPRFMVMASETGTESFDQALFDEAVTHWQASEPVLPAEQGVYTFLKAHGYYDVKAKTLRNALIDADIEVHGVVWQVDEPARHNINETLGTAARNAYPPEATVPWILSDNSVRETTAAELGQVLDARNYRMQLIFTAYNEWRAAGNGPFNYTA